jgi:N-acetylglutamate synthase-like GNAT family acetyltransferase
MAVRVRRAERRDLARVEALLKEADLPVLDPRPVLSNVLVAELDDELVGAAALDVFGRSGLVRALAVAEDRRRRGVGRELFRSLLPRAQELSLNQLYVIAAAGREFFEALGFEPVPPDELPLAVLASRRDREATAERLMGLRLR